MIDLGDDESDDDNDDDHDYNDKNDDDDNSNDDDNNGDDDSDDDDESDDGSVNSNFKPFIAYWLHLKRNKSMTIIFPSPSCHHYINCLVFL